MLKNKNLVIVGGTTGLGLSAAKAFIAAGAKVVVIGRHDTTVEEAQQKLGTNAAAIIGDATKQGTAGTAIE